MNISRTQSCLWAGYPLGSTHLARKIDGFDSVFTKQTKDRLYPPSKINEQITTPKKQSQIQHPPAYFFVFYILTLSINFKYLGFYSSSGYLFSKLKNSRLHSYFLASSTTFLIHLRLHLFCLEVRQVPLNPISILLKLTIQANLCVFF